MDPVRVSDWPSKKAKKNEGEEKEYKKEEAAKIEEEGKEYKKELEEECDEEEQDEDEEETEGEEEEEDDSDEDDDSKNMSEELKNEIIRYRTTLLEVGPYNIDFIPNWGLARAIYPIDLNRSNYPLWRAKKSLQFAIDQENKCRGSKLVLDNIVRANYSYRRAIGFVFYITFEATDTGNGIYRTKVLDKSGNTYKKVKAFEKVEKQTSEGISFDLF